MMIFKKLLHILWSIRRIKSYTRLIAGSTLWFADNELLQIANSYATDKGFPGHGYARVYDAFFRDKRDKIENVCEIGLLRHRLQSGNTEEVYGDAPSLRMWKSYFPNANIIGFDIRKFKQPSDKKSCIIQGDQKSRDDLKKIIEQQETFDLIIEDALHASEHQQVSLSFMFQYLASGGLYIIEDLQYQPEGFERDDIPKTIALLKRLQNDKVWASPVALENEKHILENEVREILFFDSIKGSNAIKFADALAVIVKA